MSTNEKPSDWCKRMQKEAADKSDMTAAYNYFQLAEMWSNQGR